MGGWICTTCGGTVTGSGHTCGPRIGSLFTGYGGLDRAVQEVLGGQVAWYSENNPAASKVLAHHHPDVPNLGDITAIDWAAVPSIDILTGGWPCQDISNAGKQAGIEGARSGLWRNLADAARVLRPRLIVVENVAAVVVRGLDRVLADLAALGFDAEWVCLRASDVGAAHRRERFFAIATSTGDTPLLRWDAAPVAQRREGTEGALGGPGVAAANTESDGWDEGRPESARVVRRSDAPVGGAELVADAPRLGHGDAGPARVGGVPAAAVAGDQREAAADAGRDSRTEDDPDRASAARCGGDTAPDSDGGRFGAGEPHVRTGQPYLGRLVAAHADGGGQQEQQERHSEPVEPGEGQHRLDTVGRVLDWGQFEPAIRRWEAILGHSAPEPAVPGRRTGRVLNPVFVEWLMGLPEGHVTAVSGLSRNDMLRLLGNGVVPQQAEAALRWLLPAITAERAA